MAKIQYTIPQPVPENRDLFRITKVNGGFRVACWATGDDGSRKWLGQPFLSGVVKTATDGNGGWKAVYYGHPKIYNKEGSDGTTSCSAPKVRTFKSFPDEKAAVFGGLVARHQEEVASWVGHLEALPSEVL